MDAMKMPLYKVYSVESADSTFLPQFWLYKFLFIVLL